MSRIVLLSERLPGQVLPALPSAGFDVKVEPLSGTSVSHLVHLAPQAVLVDAVPNPPHAFAVLTSVAAARIGVPVAVVVEWEHLERHPWHEVADELLGPGSPETEIRVRLAMLERRFGGALDAVIRLGPVVIDTDAYRVTVEGHLLDLTFREFELLRFLASSPGRAFTRTSLLREVWGYDFYGGTRTVDVHVRRLRAKLGPEHEHRIETVRGVGYRAASSLGKLEGGGAGPAAGQNLRA
jgi:DNA-binding response OmpR family regulator